MKTANLLSLSSLIVVLANVFVSVGCSTPAVGEIGDSSSAETEGDDDDDSAPAKKSTSTKSSTTSTTANQQTTPTTPADMTNPGATTGDCNTCLAANAKAVAFDTCAQSCQDQACADNCLTSTGCGGDSACTSTLSKCATACGQGADGEDGTVDPGTTPPAGDECMSCLGGSTTPAAKYLACSDQCQDQSCDDDCFNNACAGQEQACDSKLQGCEQQCFGGQ